MCQAISARCPASPLRASRTDLETVRRSPSRAGFDCPCHGATCSAVHARARLVVGIALVRGMAREARKFTFLMARRINQTLEFAAGDAHLTIGPLTVRQEAGIALQRWRQPRLILRPAGLDGRRGAAKFRGMTPIGYPQSATQTGKPLACSRVAWRASTPAWYANRSVGPP